MTPSRLDQPGRRRPAPMKPASAPTPRSSGPSSSSANAGPVSARDPERWPRGVPAPARAPSMGSAIPCCRTASASSARRAWSPRTVTEGPPLSVTYALTDAGRALLPALEQITRWSEQHLPLTERQPGLVPSTPARLPSPCCWSPAYSRAAACAPARYRPRGASTSYAHELFATAVAWVSAVLGWGEPLEGRRPCGGRQTLASLCTAAAVRRSSPSTVASSPPRSAASSPPPSPPRSGRAQQGR